ncbi:MAG TPA: JAB domain-containing protein [Nitrospira sp.]|nr:JAB domain-containing protein [Nitrospira sp.]
MAKQSIKQLSVPRFIPRYRVTLVSEGGHTAPYGVLRDSAAAAAVLRPCFAGLDREQFLVCCLDAKNVSIGVNIVSIGTLTLSLVHPREVFKAAILLNACAIIAVHNHPSGDPTPSPEDRTLTTRLRDAGDLLGIRLLDHLILGDDRLYSFADHDWPL